MMRRALSGLPLVFGLLAPLLAAQDDEPGTLFDAVAKVMAKSYYDREFRKEQWPALVARYRPAALLCGDRDEERAVVQALLGNVPATHLSLYSKATHDQLMRDLRKAESPMFGCELEQIAGRFFAMAILEGGPAARAGLLRGDEVVAIDGAGVGGHQRLDRSSDDAYLPDRPRHLILCRGVEDVVHLRIRRTRDGAVQDLHLPAEKYSSWRAASASVGVHEVAGRRIGYVHYWFIHMGGVAAHFRAAAENELAGCDAIVLDLRGRGGDGSAVAPLVRAVRELERPVIALIDGGTRSAKEVIAYRLREENVATLVGEHTARAVIPATFQPVGDEDVLMFPSFTLGKFTTEIELKGVAPHEAVVDSLAWSEGADPILTAGLRVAARKASEAR